MCDTKLCSWCHERPATPGLGGECERCAALPGHEREDGDDGWKQGANPIETAWLNGDYAAIVSMFDESHAEIERLRAACEKEALQFKMAKHQQQIALAQFELERENSHLLYTTLAKAAPDALREIKDKLNPSNNEVDKVHLEWQRRVDAEQEKRWKVEARVEALEAAIRPFAELVEVDDDGRRFVGAWDLPALKALLFAAAAALKGEA